MLILYGFLSSLLFARLSSDHWPASKRRAPAGCHLVLETREASLPGWRFLNDRRFHWLLSRVVIRSYPMGEHPRPPRRLDFQGRVGLATMLREAGLLCSGTSAAATLFAGETVPVLRCVEFPSVCTTIRARLVYFYWRHDACILSYFV